MGSSKTNLAGGDLFLSEDPHGGVADGENCLSPAKLRSTDSVYPRVVLSRVLSPAIGIYSKSQTVLARYQWTDNNSYKDQSYKGPGLNSKFEKEKERREEEGATTASSHRKEQRQRRRT